MARLWSLLLREFPEFAEQTPPMWHDHAIRGTLIWESGPALWRLYVGGEPPQAFFDALESHEAWGV